MMQDFRQLIMSGTRRWEGQCRLVPCRLRQHSCCRHYAYTVECRGSRLHPRPSTAATVARWLRLIAVAAAFTFTTVFGRRAVSLQKNNPPHDHSQVIRRPHAKCGQDLLNTVAGHREHLNGQNRKYTSDKVNKVQANNDVQKVRTYNFTTMATSKLSL